jgi:hypothetical protein
MPSQLNGKTNEYPIENGISFAEAYVFPPTQTGTTTDTNAANWGLTGRNPVSEPNEGPLGGGGSWSFFSDVSNGCRLRANSTAIRGLFGDRNWAMGFWVKVETFHPDLNSGYPIHVINPVSGTPASSCGFQFNCINDATTPGLAYFNIYNGSSNTILNTVPVVAGQWYFIAIWKYEANWRYYIDGELFGTAFHNATAACANINWGNIFQGYNTDINMSNWFVQQTTSTDSTAFDAQVAAIWTAGTTKNIKHWTGTEWVNSNGNKVWNGTAWIDIDKEYWNGTAWVAI